MATLHSNKTAVGEMLTVSNGTFLQFSSKLIVSISKQCWDKEKAVTTLLTKLQKTKNLSIEESPFVPKVPSKTKCKFTITSEENAGISQYWCYLSVIAVTILY